MYTLSNTVLLKMLPALKGPFKVNMRDDIVFSDGEPANIDDVIFSIYVECDPTYDGSSTIYALPIEGMEEYRSGMESIEKRNSSNIMEFKRNIVITGGAGFIGSHVVRLFVNKYPEYKIINLDKLTYAGNLANLKDIENKPNYKFVKMDICDFDAFYKLMQDEQIDGIIHLAAESHVDRSIKDPFTFARTNVMGTLSLLQAAKLYWESLPEKYEGKRFYHISTDEVYGALELTHPEGLRVVLTDRNLAKLKKQTPESELRKRGHGFGKSVFVISRSANDSVSRVLIKHPWIRLELTIDELEPDNRQ